MRGSANDVTKVEVSSVHPSPTIRYSKSRNVCASALSMATRRAEGQLKVVVTTVTSGR
jgi:hypothetical protein